MSYGKPLAGVCAATALFVCGVAGFPVPPSALPASEGRLVLGSANEKATFAPGAKVELKGKGFDDNAAVTLAVYSEPQQLGTTVADAAGAIDATVTLPTDLTGQHTLVALGVAPDGTAHNVQAKVTISKGAAGVSELAYSGVNAAGMAAGGLGIAIFGFALIRTARYRRPLLPQS